MIERIETIPVRVPPTRLYQGSYCKMRLSDAAGFGRELDGAFIARYRAGGALR